MNIEKQASQMIFLKLSTLFYHCLLLVLNNFPLLGDSRERVKTKERYMSHTYKELKEKAEDYIFENFAIQGGVLPVHFGYNDIIETFIEAYKKGVEDKQK